MADWLQTVYDAKRTGASILLTDLDVAMTFLEVANATRNPETRQRNYGNAWKAYDAVRHFLPQMVFTDAEAKLIQEKLEALRKRLEAIGKASPDGL